MAANSPYVNPPIKTNKINFFSFLFSKICESSCGKSKSDDNFNNISLILIHPLAKAFSNKRINIGQ